MAAAATSPILRRLTTAAAAVAEAAATTKSNPFTALKSSIRAESNPETIANLFRSALHLPRFHAHRPLFQLAVDKLSRLRRPDLVDSILSESLESPNSPNSEGFLSRLILLYSHANLPDKAQQLFDKIPTPTDKSLSALLSCFLQLSLYDRVIDTFNSVTGFTPGVVSHNVVMQALGAKGDMAGARKVFDEMCGKGIVPDIVSYNTLLTGYLKSGDGEGFDSVLKEISDAGVELNVVTYNCRIARFCNSGASFKGEELLDVMVAKKIEPNVSTFQYLVAGYCKEGNVDGAVKVFHRLKVMNRRNEIDGVLPNAQTYVPLIKGLVEKTRFDTAYGICMEGLARKVVPPLELVKQLIEGLVKDSKNQEAKQVAEKMRSVVRGRAVDAWKKKESAISF